MAIPATQMRPGMIIKHNNELHAVFSVEHRTPGNLRAFIQAKLQKPAHRCHVRTPLSVS